MASRFSVVLALFGLTLVLVGCNPNPQPNPGANSPKQKASQALNQNQSAGAKELLGDKKPSKLTKVVLLLNWYPEAEHGGFYAAQVHDIYAKYGLDVEIRPGGKTIVVPQELVLNRVQFGVANADDVLVARNQDIDLIALTAPIQDGPRCILTRKDSGIDSFEKLKNIKLQIDSTRPYVPFLKSKGFLQEGVEVVPYFGSVAQVVADKNVACQGYNFSEPFMARQQGTDVNELMLSTIGYNPYASLLVTTSTYAKKNDDLCKRMTLASIEGWKMYLSDPGKTNDLILKNNKQGLEKDALEYGVTALKKLCLPGSLDEAKIGTMSEERWQALFDTLVELKIIEAAKVRIGDAYTLKYLP